MKGIFKFGAVVFAILIVAVSILVICNMGNIVSSDNIVNMLDMLSRTNEARLITIGVFSVIAILAILFAIFIDNSESSSGGSLVLPLSTGNIVITGQTFETMVLNVCRKYNSFKNVRARVDIKEEGLEVKVFVFVLEGTVVSDIMVELQEDIKSTILKQTTVEVKTVEVKVKGIYSLNETVQA